MGQVIYFLSLNKNPDAKHIGEKLSHKSGREKKKTNIGNYLRTKTKTA